MAKVQGARLVVCQSLLSTNNPEIDHIRTRQEALHPTALQTNKHSICNTSDVPSFLFICFFLIKPTCKSPSSKNSLMDCGVPIKNNQFV